MRLVKDRQGASRRNGVAPMVIIIIVIIVIVIIIIIIFKCKV